MLQSAVLSLAFYHHPLLDGLRQLHIACATFIGLCRKPELPGHHPLLTAAWSSHSAWDMKDRAPQYCSLASEVTSVCSTLQFCNKMGFPILETAKVSSETFFPLKAACVKAFQRFWSEGKSAPASARLKTRVHCNSIPSCEAMHRAQHGPSPSKRHGDIGMQSGDTALNIWLGQGPACMRCDSNKGALYSY